MKDRVNDVENRERETTFMELGGQGSHKLRLQGSQGQKVGKFR